MPKTTKHKINSVYQFDHESVINEDGEEETNPTVHTHGNDDSRGEIY